MDDIGAEHDVFGANAMMLSSASSKTAVATAYYLSRRKAHALRVIGLTSSANATFACGLGCCDEVLGYSGWRKAVACDTPTLYRYIDFSGDAVLRRSIHEHFGKALRYTCSVCGTHWQALGSAAGPPGPKPNLFFAPTHAQGHTRRVLARLRRRVTGVLD